MPERKYSGNTFVQASIIPILTFIIRSADLMTHALLNLCNVINYNKAFKQFLCKN